MKTIIYFILLACLTFFSNTHRSLASSVLEIELHHNNEYEKRAKKLLLDLEYRYDLSPFLFTKKIKIQSRAISRSHPILTLNTRFIDKPNAFFSTFLHEQMHWFFSKEENKKPIKKFIDEMKKLYPRIPVGRDLGSAKNEYSSYLHLGINLLEYDALKHFIGEEKAKEWFKEANIYSWINNQVLKNYPKIKLALIRHHLIIHEITNDHYSDLQRRY